ncbi:MAG: PAS domain S-box protein [Chloroherpetonaceae bacterium]|nr:PAS domain S-box protein [Chloroherpetonaceae bacterium]
MTEKLKQVLRESCKSEDAFDRVLKTYEEETQLVKSKLSLEQEMYHSIFDSAIVGIGLMDSNFQIRSINPAFEIMLEYSESEILRKSPAFFTHPDDWKEQANYLEKLFNGEISKFSLPKRYITKSGIEKWVRIHVSTFLTDQNEKCFISVSRKITEEKLIEDQLKESELKYRQLVESITEFILISKPDTTITFSNKALQSALGVSASDLLGKRWKDFAQPDDIIDIENKIKELTPSNPFFKTENRDLRGNGKFGWTQWVNLGVFDQNDMLLEIRSVGRDINDFKEAQLKLIESETKLNAIQNSTTDSLILISKDHKVLSINKKASTDTEAIFGEKIKEGYDFRKLLPFFKPEVTDIYYASFNNALQGEVVDFEYAIDLGPFKNWYHWTYFPVYDTHEELIGVCFRTIDISERKQIGLTLEKQQTLLRETASLAKVGSWEFDLKTEEINWSEETFNIYERPLFLGNPSYQDFRTLHTPEHISKLEELISSSIKHLRPYTFESTIYCKSGAIKTIRALGKPIIENGKAVKLVGYIQDITELKRQESESLSLQFELANILENTSEAYLKLNKNREFVYVNQNFEKMIRVDAATIIGHCIWDVFPEAVKTNFYHFYERTIEEKTHFKFQEFYTPLNMWFEVSSYPSKDGGLTAFFREITNEKEREKALIENQDFLQSIYYGINTPIFVYDVEGYKQFRFAGLNPAFEFGYGVKAYEMNGKLLSDLSSIQFGDLNRMINLLQQCVETGSEVSFEETIYRDGEPRYFITRINPLRDNGGDIYRLIGSSIDITERKLAEEKLLQNEAMLSETEHIAKIGSWSFDVASERIKWSKEVFSIFDRDEAAGEPSFDETNLYFNKEDQKVHRKTVQDSIKHAEPYEVTLKISTSKCEKWILIVGKVEVDETHHVKRLYGTVQDVTQSVESKHERDLIYQQLLQSQKMESVGVLASGVAHEFNNILMGILGNAELLIKDFEQDPRKKKRITTIIDNSHRASTIIRQMLGFARQGKAESTVFNLVGSLQSIIDILEPSLDKRIKVLFSPPASLHQAFGDKGQIEQAILNIAVNAVDALTEKLSDKIDNGEIRFELSTSVIPPKFAIPNKIPTLQEFIHLRISDNGVGIPEEIREKIFEPFFTTKDVGKGTGLGLAMVYGIIKNHNGFIFVESELGAGTSFHIFLPSDLNQKTETIPVSNFKDRITVKRCILVVDDEPMIRHYLSESLTNVGFKVETAENGKVACQAVEQSPTKYDLILIDRNMPELNGEESILRIREVTTHPKIIMMTGYLENNRFEDLEKLGVTSIVQKPFTIEKIMDFIASSLK